MRIITGKHKGRKLADFYKLKKLRPTTDKNRESLFNILQSANFLQEIHFDITKCNLLDTFCGTGSIGFEALSRGVRSVTFIEGNSDHLEITKQNSKILKEEDKCEFIKTDLTKPIFKSNKEHNLIYIDPPYNEELLEISFQNLLKSGFIAKEAIIIFEHSTFEKLNLEKLKELTFLREKTYSKTIFSFFRY